MEPRTVLLEQGGGDPAEAEDLRAATRDLQEVADEVRVLPRSVVDPFDPAIWDGVPARRTEEQVRVQRDGLAALLRSWTVEEPPEARSCGCTPTPAAISQEMQNSSCGRYSPVSGEGPEAVEEATARKRPRSKMHDGEVDIDVDLVRRLVAAQFPELADLPIRAVRSTATVNAIYRLGEHLCARLPRVEEWARDLEKEWHWLPKLAPHLSLQVPEPVTKGQPAETFPFSWAIYGWIDGQPYADELVADEQQAARDLAQFVIELRGIESGAGAPRGGRRPLRELDAITRAAIESAQGVIAAEAAAAWERALAAPAWQGTPVWVHADLLRPNVLVRDGRLCAVIDFGGAGVGDPAADVIAAWSMFGHTGRAAFRAALDVDDGTWNRARGLALHQAVMIVPYYIQTNPAFVALAKRTIEQVVADIDA